MDYSFLTLFVPRNESSSRGPLVPWNFRTLELSFQQNFRSAELSCLNNFRTNVGRSFLLAAHFD
jgi:hypothetical protein